MNIGTATRGKNQASIEIVSDTEIVIARTFAAPRDLVFEAITMPEHVRLWYGCDGMTMMNESLDRLEALVASQAR
jgi:uncharacterized protein YndB with AHSA1/START domain